MKFRSGVKRAEMANAIDQYVSDTIGEVSGSLRLFALNPLAKQIHTLGKKKIISHFFQFANSQRHSAYTGYKLISK